jgi:hypothetical protein
MAMAIPFDDVTTPETDTPSFEPWVTIRHHGQKPTRQTRIRYQQAPEEGV